MAESTEDLVNKRLSAANRKLAGQSGRRRGEGDIDFALRREKEAIRKRQEAEKAQADARAAEAQADLSVADRTRQRGAKDLAAGMELMGRADARRAVRVRNRGYETTKRFTDTMGTGARRRGLFQPGRAMVPADVPPAEAVAEAPPPMDEPDARTSEGVPAQAARAVPREALARGVPGEGPEMPAEAVPLEGEPPPGETMDEQIARLEAEAAAASPDDLEALAAADYAEQAAQEMVGEPAGPSPGVIQRQIDAAEQLANAKISTEQEKADALTEASAQAQQALDEAEAARQEDAARLEQRAEASRIANQTVEDLTTKARAMGAVDPRRAWTNMGTGRKVAFMLGIAATQIGRGMRGLDTSQVMEPLRRYVAEDIAQQENERAKAGEDISRARQVAGDQASLLDQARAVTDDKQTARAMVEQARFRQMKLDLEARMAEAGVGQANAEQEALLTALEEEIANKQRIIDATTDANPEYLTKSVPLYSKGQREAMRMAGKGLIESGVGSQERAEAQEAKLEVQGVDALLKQSEAAAKAQDKVAQQAYKFGADTAVAQQVVGLIDNVIQQDDIAGYGLTAGAGILPGAKSTEDDLDAIAEALGRLQSQGAITEDELASFNEMIRGGTTLGGESRLRKNLERVRGMVMMRIEAHERGMDPKAREYYNRNVAGADFEARWTGGTGTKPIRED